MQFELSWKDLGQEYRTETDELPRVRVHMAKQNLGDLSRNRSRERSIPAFFKLSEGRITRAVLESFEQDGKQPVLLSDQSQAELGLLKDMRKNMLFLRIRRLR